MQISENELNIIKKRERSLPPAVIENSPHILELSRFIHSNPELGSEEFKSSGYFVEKLKKLGVEVQENYLGMKTSFLATIGSGSPKVAILAEYDALPIGHACGHNIIGSWAFGVFASLKDEITKGTVLLVGTPAEEGRGEYASSKVKIAPELKKKGVEAVFTVHPGGEWEVGGHLLGTLRYSFRFMGRDAHAAASPEHGINALDSAVSFYTQLRMLHGMLGRHHQIVLSAIIKDGGVAPNIIPGRAEVWADMRSEDDSFLTQIEERVLRIAQGCAAANGCRLEYDQLIPRLSPRKRYEVLDSLYLKHARNYLGENVVGPEEAYRKMPRASSDVGNVSQIIPTVHLGIKVGPSGLPGHSEEMKFCSGMVESEEALLTAVAIGHDSILEYLAEH
jgi:amidohydrolase